MVCDAIGLDTGSASQDYIQLYEGDAEAPDGQLGTHPANGYSNPQRNRRGGNLRAARLGWFIAITTRSAQSIEPSIRWSVCAARRTNVP